MEDRAGNIIQELRKYARDRNMIGTEGQASEQW